MKNLNQIFVFAFLISFSLNFSAQEYAMNSIKTSNSLYYNEVNNNEITPLLNNKTFTYKYQGEEVLVVFTDKEHVEYFNNNKNYIKSDVYWVSEDECILIIKESNLPKFPFKKGAKLKMKVTKIKGNTIYYESTLAGKTWEGKMRRK